MIYSTPKDLFPIPNLALEIHEFIDENRMPWRIARVQNGFFVAYFGTDYFRDDYFSIDISDDKHQLLNNTGCFFVHDTSFEAYYSFRDILKSGSTDTIWDTIGDLLKARLQRDPGLIECEIVKR